MGPFLKSWQSVINSKFSFGYRSPMLIIVFAAAWQWSLSDFPKALVLEKYTYKTFRATKSYMSRGISPCILNLSRDVVVWSTSRHGCFTPGKRAPLSH